MSTLSFLLSHTPQAVLMAGLFALGGAAAWAVLRWRVEFILATPRAFARLLTNVINRRPSWITLTLFIFSFNVTAMFLYMLAGVIPWAAHLVAFLTGLNVLCAGILAREMAPPPVAPPPPLSAWAQLCGLLTFLLELPCFWYAMAMASTIDLSLWQMISAHSFAALLPRVQAYLLLLAPVLALSAAAESYAIACSLPPKPAA